ncbi:MAG: sorting protein, partial [Verrucomicrobiaceae bacterium]|nr:sorting protein [Verrucomicrobiaceae bacterium]
MKFTKSTVAVLLAVAHATLLAASAFAAPVTPPAAGDIFLGVRASGGQGSGTSYIINVGNDSAFRGAAAGSILDLGSIDADLSSAFGSNWKTRADLSWGVFGTRNQANPTLYGSRAQSPFGSSAVAYPALDQSGRAATNTEIVSLLDAYSSLESTGNAKAAKQSNNPVAGSYNYQVGTAGTSDFGSLSQWTSIEGNFANGATRTALDLFRYSGNTSTGVNTAERLGAFSISSAGGVSFLAGPVVNKVQLLSSTVSVQEDAGTAAITAERLGDGSANAINVTFEITDGTAEAGTDFTLPSSLTLNFAANETTKIISVPLTNRTGFYGTRNFT